MYNKTTTKIIILALQTSPMFKKNKGTRMQNYKIEKKILLLKNFEFLQNH